MTPLALGPYTVHPKAQDKIGVVAYRWHPERGLQWWWKNGGYWEDAPSIFTPEPADVEVSFPDSKDEPAK